MKWSVVLSTVIGIAVTTVLVGMNGFSMILRGIAVAGWGILAVVAFHVLQMAFASLAWRRVTLGPTVPSRAVFLRLRWIREAVNALLPVTQIGGEFVVARLLALEGVSLGTASAGVTVDLTIEMLSQIVFTLFGLGLLMMMPHDAAVAYWVASGIVIATAVGAAFVLSQFLGLFWLIEQGLLRLAKSAGWQRQGDAEGLHAGIVALYKSPRRLTIAGANHLISWLLGGIEVMLALHVVGVSVGLRDGLIIESLGQAFRSVGFAVPGGLGIQEGGYVLACGLVGVAAPNAIELSLLKRIREIALGVPGLIAWRVIEGRHAAGRSLLSSSTTAVASGRAS